MLLGAIAAAAIYVIRLDRIITHQFEGRRWTLPAQVYAAPLELYAGLPLAGADLEKELRRLARRCGVSPPGKSARAKRRSR